jgi:uncharacterized HAD superfamily protein
MINISLDIDGTISEYPLHWLAFLNTRLESNFISTDEAKRVLGLKEYKKNKDLYRKSEEKYSIPIKSEFISLANTIYRFGGKVFINSQRPFSKYPSMLKSTSDWLKKSNFPFESIHEKTVSNLKHQEIKYHFDDEMVECLRLSKILSIEKLFLINQINNQICFQSRIVEINPKISIHQIIEFIFANQ